MKSYVFHAELEQEEDGRWSAWIDALPGCATWGQSREEALDPLAGEVYLCQPDVRQLLARLVLV